MMKIMMMMRMMMMMMMMIMMMVIFTLKDYNKGVTKSYLHTINADQPKRHKRKEYLLLLTPLTYHS
jgi:ABC-type transporter MlaC component